MTHLENHIARVEAWAAARGLYDTDSPMVQFGKMIGELGELIIGIANNDIEEIKDGIGDVRVCLINVCKIAGWEFSEMDATRVVLSQLGSLLCSAERILHAIESKDETVEAEWLNSALASIAHSHNLTLEECDDHAWEQIKDRKGKTVGGEFIKEVQ